MANVKAKAKRRTDEDVAKFLLGDSKPSADASGLLSAILEEIGGPRELARIFARQLRDEDTGAQTKQRLLDTIQRLIIMCTQHDLSRQIEPSDMTDDDLHRVALSLLGKVKNANPTGPGTQEGEA